MRSSGRPCSTWLAVIVPVQYASGVNQGSMSRTPPGLRWRRMQARALRMRSSVRTYPIELNRQVTTSKLRSRAKSAMSASWNGTPGQRSRATLEQRRVEVEALDLVALAQQLEVASGSATHVEQASAPPEPGSSSTCLR